MNKLSLLSTLIVPIILTSCSTPSSSVVDRNGFGNHFFDSNYQDNYYIDNGYLYNGHYGKGPSINGGNENRYYTNRGEGNDYLDAYIYRPVKL